MRGNDLLDARMQHYMVAAIKRLSHAAESSLQRLMACSA
jgi:hypothetical protein